MTTAAPHELPPHTRRPGETGRAHQALLAHLEAGPRRTLKETAQKTSLSYVAVKGYSRRWHWDARAREHDDNDLAPAFAPSAPSIDLEPTADELAALSPEAVRLIARAIVAERRAQVAALEEMNRVARLLLRALEAAGATKPSPAA